MLLLLAAWLLMKNKVNNLTLGCLHNEHSATCTHRALLFIAVGCYQQVKQS